MSPKSQSASSPPSTAPVGQSDSQAFTTKSLSERVISRQKQLDEKSKAMTQAMTSAVEQAEVNTSLFIQKEQEKIEKFIKYQRGQNQEFLKNQKKEMTQFIEKEMKKLSSEISRSTKISLTSLKSIMRLRVYTPMIMISIMSVIILVLGILIGGLLTGYSIAKRYPKATEYVMCRKIENDQGSLICLPYL